jgi:hypothetical protein
LKEIQYNTVYCIFSSDTPKLVLGIVSEIRYNTKVFYQKTTAHLLANLDCIQQPNWEIQRIQYCIGELVVQFFQYNTDTMYWDKNRYRYMCFIGFSIGPGLWRWRFPANFGVD